MPSEIIVFGDGTTYRRTGECDGCAREDVPTAQCCTYVMVPDRVLSRDELRWLELHGLDESVERDVRLDRRCTALVLGRCALFGSPDRPIMCSSYPELPALDAGCAFTFERIN